VDGGATWQSTPFNLGGVRTPVEILALNPQRPGLVIGGVGWGGLHEYEVSPDLGVTLSGLGPNVAAGSTASLHVTVQNYGPHAASAAHVSLTVPDFLTLTPPANCTLLAQVLHCDLPSMPVGTIRTIDLAFNVNATPASGFIRADLTGHEPDSVGGNNVAISGAQSEPQSDLGVTLTAPSTVTVGKSTTFVATVTNLGPHASPDTHLEVALPGGAFGVSASTTAGTCVGNGSVQTTYKCELGTVPAGGTVAVTITVRGDLAATHTINAEVVGLNTDASASNDEASTTFQVNPAPGDSNNGGGDGGGSGGGGSFDWLMLLLLASVLAWRKWRHPCFPKNRNVPALR